MEHTKTFTGLFFARLPQFNDLEAFEAAKEDGDGDCDFSSIQPLYCRELIFTEEKILLSPSLEQRNVIVIIVQKEVKKSRGFLDLLGRLNIKILRNVDVTKSLFQYCLSFTLNQKLAPLWNKVGEFYVQGREFLAQFGKLNAVCIQINVIDKISLAIEALNVKLIASKPEHFCSAVNTMVRFNSDPLYHIQSISIEDNFCYVLPSFKRGRVARISHKLPTDGIFNDYEALRKHWKVLYGWRLPVTESVFYDVEFCNLREKIFTYPASCVRSSEPIVTYRCDQQEIFSSFIQDLRHRMPNICGIPLRFTAAPLYPLDKLYSASCANQSNLTRAAPQLKSCKQFEIRMQTKPAVLGREVQPTARSNSTESRDTCTNPGDINQRISATSSDLTVTSRTASEAESVVKTSTVQQSRIIPTFTSFKSQSIGTGKRSNTKRNLKSIDAPSHITLPTTRPDSAKRKERPNNVVMNKKLHSSSTSDKEKDLHVKRHKSLTNSLHSLETVLDGNKSVNPTCNLDISVGGGQSTICYSNQVEQSGLQDENYETHSETALHTKCVSGEETKKLPDDPSFNATKISPLTHNERNFLNKSARKLTGVQEALMETTNASNKANSIQMQGDSGQPLKTQPRCKPRVQMNIDVREYALNSKLNKVNAITLSCWLKEQGIVVRSKDKKTDLVEKVMQLVGAQKHEL